jgi:hypothetical protein
MVCWGELPKGVVNGRIDSMNLPRILMISGLEVTSIWGSFRSGMRYIRSRNAV